MRTLIISTQTPELAKIQNNDFPCAGGTARALLDMLSGTDTAYEESIIYVHHDYQPKPAELLVIQEAVKNHSTIYITGHGQTESDGLSGVYQAIAPSTANLPALSRAESGRLLDVSCQHYVDLILSGNTLQPGDTIFVVLWACYGAAGNEYSTAAQLTEALMAKKINSVVVASTTPMPRFDGHYARTEIQQSCLRFRAKSIDNIRLFHRTPQGLDILEVKQDLYCYHTGVSIGLHNTHQMASLTPLNERLHGADVKKIALDQPEMSIINQARRPSRVVSSEHQRIPEELLALFKSRLPTKPEGADPVATKDNIHQYSFYHGNISREEAYRKLEESGDSKAFLARSYQNFHNQFVLTYKIMADATYLNSRFTQNNNGWFFIDENSQDYYPTLVKLLQSIDVEMKDGLTKVANPPKEMSPAAVENKATNTIASQATPANGLMDEKPAITSPRVMAVSTAVSNVHQSILQQNSYQAIISWFIQNTNNPNEDQVDIPLKVLSQIKQLYGNRQANCYFLFLKDISTNNDWQWISEKRLPLLLAELHHEVVALLQITIELIKSNAFTMAVLAQCVNEAHADHNIFLIAVQRLLRDDSDYSNFFMPVKKSRGDALMQHLIDHVNEHTFFSPYCATDLEHTVGDEVSSGFAHNTVREKAIRHCVEKMSALIYPLQNGVEKKQQKTIDACLNSLRLMSLSPTSENFNQQKVKLIAGLNIIATVGHHQETKHLIHCINALTLPPAKKSFFSTLRLGR